MHGLITVNKEGLWKALDENVKSSWNELGSSIRKFLLQKSLKLNMVWKHRKGMDLNPFPRNILAY